MTPKLKRILTELRIDARQSLTKLSKKTHIAISTIHDMMKIDKTIIKYTILPDWNAMGFNIRISMAIKANNRKDVKEYLLNSLYLNSLYRINNGYDFMADLIFRTIRDMEDFIEELKKFEIIYQLYYLIEPIKQETFFSNHEVTKII